MLFTMTVPFLEVVLHTTNEVFKRPNTIHLGLDKRVDVVKVKSAKDQEEDEMNDSMSSAVLRLTFRLLLPIGSLIFTVNFWVVGLIASNSFGDIQDPNMTDCITVDLH